MLISIIMPVYNSAKFLESAIESVINQSYDDWELILVDDGSSDGSEKICDLYINKDQRIRVYHKKNDGVCSARNVGIGVAKGEYISFIDNDDIYDKDYLRILTSFVNIGRFDVVKCGRNNVRITPDLRKIKETVSTVSIDKVLDFPEFVYEYYNIKSTGCLSSVWNGMYRTDFLRNNGLLFREDMKHGNEDLLFNYEVFLNQPKIAISSHVLYTHYYRISHSTSTKFYDDQVTSRIEAIKKELMIIKGIDSSSDLILVEFEGIRECFRILAQCSDAKLRKKLICQVEKNLNFEVLKKQNIVCDRLSNKQKLDWFLFKNHMYNIYFSYKNFQRKVES